MSRWQNINDWFDIRRGEGKVVFLSLLGAFTVIASLTLGRATSVAAFTDHFKAPNLPYITAAVAALGFPVITASTRMLQRRQALPMLRSLLLILALGLAGQWFATGHEALRGPVVVVYYLWTALGSLLVASFFWVLVSDSFALRGAKRLFGLISAGGTAGGLVAGFLLNFYSPRLSDPLDLIPLLTGLLLAFLAALFWWPKPRDGFKPPGSFQDQQQDVGGLALIRRNPHLRLIAAIVMSATLATSLLDYLFREAAHAASAGHPEPGAAMAGILGAFYGWTGGIALLIQLGVAGRLMTRMGISSLLSILPVILMLGSVGIGLWPVMALITLVKGTDTVLRKALFRPTVEVLYLPLASDLRRRAKGIIDTALDSVAEGLGAGLIFLVVKVIGAPSQTLALLAALVGLLFLLLTRRMDRQYLRTVKRRLHENESIAVGQQADPHNQDNLLTAGFTRLDLKSIMDPGPAGASSSTGSEASPADRTLVQLRSREPGEVERAMAWPGPWTEPHIKALVSLLARDDFSHQAGNKIRVLGDVALPVLLLCMGDEWTDIVVRRRIPRLLAEMGGAEAEEALLNLLSAKRFDLRYRGAVALTQRRKGNLPSAGGQGAERIWEAIRFETSRTRAVWELQQLQEDVEVKDGFVLDTIEERSRLSLQHTFRLLGLVLEPAPVRAAYRGLVLDNERLHEFALEYLEQTLPSDIRKSLWDVIGDPAPARKAGGSRSLDVVVADLMDSQQSLFIDFEDRSELKDREGGPTRDQAPDQGR